MDKVGMTLRQLLFIRNRLNQGKLLTNVEYDSNTRDLYVEYDGANFRVDTDGTVYRKQDWQFVGYWNEVR